MLTRLAASVTLVGLSVLAACSSSTAPEMSSEGLDYQALLAEAACPIEEIALTTNWQASGWVSFPNGPGFHYHVPADFQRAQVQGIDSYVGLWASGELRFISYDFGWYSNPLDGAKLSLAGYSACRDTIGGQPVALVFGWDSAGRFWRAARPKYIVAASWRNVPPRGEPATHLTMVTASDRAEDRPILLAILRSVQFKP